MTGRDAIGIIRMDFVKLQSDGILPLLGGAYLTEQDGQIVYCENGIDPVVVEHMPVSMQTNILMRMMKGTQFHPKHK